MKKGNLYVFFGILFCYAFLYMATTKRPVCEDDCEKVADVSQSLRKNRNYISFVMRCNRPYNISDSLCVFVIDTTGINWNLLADTACSISATNGLVNQKIFIIKTFNTPPYQDTVAYTQCP